MKVIAYQVLPLGELTNSYSVWSIIDVVLYLSSGVSSSIQAPETNGNCITNNNADRTINRVLILNCKRDPQTNFAEDVVMIDISPKMPLTTTDYLLI